MCRLFDGEELHARCAMMFKRELLESHYMDQGRISPQPTTLRVCGTVARTHWTHGWMRWSGQKMLEFKKIEDDGNVATFEYYPEGKGEPGTVVLDRSVGIVSVLSVSPNDRHGRYAEHMFAEARRMLRDGSVRDGGTVFWY